MPVLIPAGLYDDIRAAGWHFRAARSWQHDKLRVCAVRVIASAVGLYLLGESPDQVRAAVADALGYPFRIGRRERPLT